MEQITIPAHLDNLKTLFSFTSGVMEKDNIDISLQNKINIAIEEVFVNIANYAYPAVNGDVTICVKSESDKIIFEFKDTGIPYNPLEKPDPDVTLSAEDRVIGGLGIFMVKKIMDDVQYKYEDDQNILTLIKNK